MNNLPFRTCLLLPSLSLALLAACDPDPEPPPPAAAVPEPEALRLLPLAAGDLAAPELAASAPPASPAIDRSPVALSWPIDQTSSDLAAAPARPPESRAWWRLASPQELATGVPLVISEPGALLKLSPEAGAALALDQLELETPAGAIHRGDAGLRPLADPEHLRDAGMPLSPGTILLEIRPELGVGTFTLRAAAAARVLVYVLERASATTLSLAPASDVAFAGASVRVTARLHQDDAVLEATSIAGELLGPDGATTPIGLTRDPEGTYSGHVTAPAVPVQGALYTLQVRAEGKSRQGLALRRDAVGAVSLALPTARFTAAAARDPGPGELRVRLAVEVAAASRFGVSAVLHGTSAGGELQPIGVAQSAQWLEPGVHHLALVFDADTLAASRLGAPYELRDLRLADQGRMSVLHRQARALPLAR